MMRQALLAALLVATSAGAHPYAVTLLEAEVNAKDRVLECSLRIYPEQLERGLSLEAGEAVDLERTKDVDERIERYLGKRLRITPAAASSENGEKEGEPGPSVPKPTPIRWVGKEVSHKAAWLYFEIPLDVDLERATVFDAILTEVNPEQINTVNLTWGNRVATCHLTKAEPSQPVRWQEKGKSKRARPKGGIPF